MCFLFHSKTVYLQHELWWTTKIYLKLFVTPLAAFRWMNDNSFKRAVNELEKRSLFSLYLGLCSGSCQAQYGIAWFRGAVVFYVKSLLTPSRFVLHASRPCVENGGMSLSSSFVSYYDNTSLQRPIINVISWGLDSQASVSTLMFLAPLSRYPIPSWLYFPAH